MPVGSHKDAFMAHQKVKKIYSDNADNNLPKTAAQILLDFVKSQRQIISENIPETIELTDIEKYDKEKVREALISVENLCGKCNENHDNNCFVNQARRVLIAMLSGVDIKEKFNGAQSLDELLKIAEDMQIENSKKKNEEAAKAPHAGEETESAMCVINDRIYENIENEINELSNKIINLKKDYVELKEKDVFRAALIDEVVATIKSVSNGNFQNPMPVHEDEQLGKIAVAFNTMLETINKTLKNLDAEVAKRSSELKMLMGNVKIGIFTINNDFRINREYSKECLKIFDCEEIGGMNFFDLIKVYDKQLEKKEQIKNFLSLYFNGMALDNDSMNSLNPLGEHQLNSKYLQFTFFPVKSNIDDTVTNILVQCVDFTANKLLQMEINAKDAEGRQIRKMILNREAFYDFISETLHMLKNAVDITKDKITIDEVSELYRIAHTIKGGAGCFDLNELIKHTGDFEEILGKIIKTRTIEAGIEEQIASNVLKIEQIFNEVIEYSEKIFGKKASESEELEFNFKKKHLDLLLETVRRSAGEPAKLNEVLNGFYDLPAHRVFAKSFAMIQPLAERLGKSVRLGVTGAETMVPFETAPKLSEVMLHLLRNAVDHAIELPEEREALQKNIEGNINIVIEKNKDVLDICISDDGCGLDPAKISAAALKKCVVTAEELKSMDENDKLGLIFRAGFSTKADVTSTSGRGVGMDIIKNAVENVLHGNLSFKSVIGRGTDFIIKIPLYGRK